MKRTIKLSESNFRRIISESVRTILREMGEEFNGGMDNSAQIAKQKFIEGLKGKFTTEWYVYDRSRKAGVACAYANCDLDNFTISVCSEDGWEIWSDDVPCKLELTRHSIHRPATRLEPEEWGDAEGCIKSMDLDDLLYREPGSSEEKVLPADDEIRQAIEMYMPIDDGLNALEANEADYYEGQREEYYDRRREEEMLRNAGH